MRSLHNHLKKDGRSSQHQTKSSTGKKKEKITLMDLENDRSDDDDDGDNPLPEKERQMYEALEKELTRCQRCGPTHFCKVSRDGTHVNLTFNQRRSWAVALVCPLTHFLSVSYYESPFRGVVLFTGVPSGNLMSHQN